MSTPTHEQITRSRLLLQDPYAHMEDIEEPETLVSAASTDTKDNNNNKLAHAPYVTSRGAHPVSKVKYTSSENPYARFDELDYTNTVNTNTLLQTADIEMIVDKIHRSLWEHRDKYWPNGVPANPVDLLEPSVAFSSIGYEFSICESLDDYRKGKNYKIAGIVDQPNKKAYISNQFSHEIQRFTSAHELGHALMHQGAGLHRDRGLDGSPINGKKSRIEIEADKFATLFLMPKKLVLRRFEQLFGTQVFHLNDATEFALDPGDKLNLMSIAKNPRRLSRILAEATHYNNSHFISLAKQFRVSVEAMAIRLEELKIIKI